VEGIRTIVCEESKLKKKIDFKEKNKAVDLVAKSPNNKNSTSGGEKKVPKHGLKLEKETIQFQFERGGKVLDVQAENNVTRPSEKQGASNQQKRDAHCEPRPPRP